MQFLPSLSPIAPNYDAFLLDLWGCVHDGTALYPGAAECLRELKSSGKRVLFLSNAPRRAVRAQVVLDRLGIPRDLYEAVVTSGEVGYAALAGTPLPSTYFYIGPPHDADVLSGLPYRPAQTLEQAGFILNVGFGSEGEGRQDWRELLAPALKLGLPMVCLNPDLEVVKITGERHPCAGIIAKEYESLGGRVTYFGKPYPEVYEHCLALWPGTPRGRILAVGDGLHTDILGAKRSGIASALVTGGILHKELGDVSEQAVRAYLATQDVQPDYVLPGLCW